VVQAARARVVLRHVVDGLALRRREGRHLDQRLHALVMARLGDDHPAPRMADEHDRAGLGVESSARGR
jgi:hypothetical protein